jgi:hypothetical protein
MKKTTANGKSARSVKSKSRFKGSSSTQASLLKKLTEDIYYRHPNYFFLNGSGSYENVTLRSSRICWNSGLTMPGSTATVA